MTDAAPAVEPETPPHPAPFSAKVLDRLVEILRAEYERRPGPLRVLDPFAGIGRIHDLAEHVPALDTVGVELEPEWAAAHPQTIVGDATALPAEWTETFDVLATSPCYGNRMADHHDARDASRRITYKHKLGRDLTPGSAAVLQWGPAYRDLHQRAWGEADRVLRPGALAVINLSNHVRGGRVQRVVEWHLYEWLVRGYLVVAVTPVDTPRMGFGANRDKRVDAEHLLVLRKPGDAGA